MQRFAEPWRTTALRTGSLALLIGVVLSIATRRPAALLVGTLMALWFTLGGHFVELLFRNRIRWRISQSPLVQASARIMCWFVGGSLLYAGALATRLVLTGNRVFPWPWWTGGLLFLGLELVVHGLLQLRRQPSFYDGRG
ncbi:MAG TPA: hypothetical protein VFP39_07255 [Gemmatimonadales bacterium]|nr:hypothetical protein [Gemmatimonadales bacterium]